MIEQPGVRYGISNALLVAAMFSAAASQLPGKETEVLTLIVAGLASCGLSLLLRASIGVAAWAMFTGFVVNRLGMLTFHHYDLVRLVVFPLATVAIAAVARGGYLIVKEHAHE